MAKGQENLDKNYNELVEMHHVLAKDAGFFSETAASNVKYEPSEDIESAAAPISGRYGGAGAAAAARTGSLGFVTGVILTEKMGNFERVVFRALRGNMFLKHADVTEPIIDPVSVRSVPISTVVIALTWSAIG